MKLLSGLLLPGLCLLLGLLAWDPAAAQSLSLDWATGCGSDDLNSAQGAVDLAVDAQGNSYVTGTFSDTVAFGSTRLGSAGGTDLFVAKLSPQGRYLWAVRGGGPGYERATAIAVNAAGQVFVTGSFGDSVARFGASVLRNPNAAPLPAYAAQLVVAALDAGTGAWQWAQAAGGGSGVAEGVALATDPRGSVYLAGVIEDGPSAVLGPFTLPAPASYPLFWSDAFVARLDAATGVWQWAQRGGDAHSNVPTALALDATGHLYLAGTFIGMSAVVGGALLTTAVYRGCDAYVARLDAATGTWQWVTQANPQSQVVRLSTRLRFSSLLVGPAGGVYATGTFGELVAAVGNSRLVNNSSPQGGPGGYYTDVLVARLDAATGAWRWAVGGGGRGPDVLSGLVPDGPGRLLAIGRISEPFGIATPPPGPGSRFGSATVTSAGADDLLVAQLDTAGTWRWAVRAGTQQFESLDRLRRDAAGHFYALGSFTGPAFGLGTVSVPAPPVPGRFTTTYVARLGNTLLPTRAGAEPAGFALYPNPSAGTTTVTGLAAGQTVQVLDALGRVVATATVPPAGQLALRLPAGQAGLYLVRAGVLTRRWLVE